MITEQINQQTPQIINTHLTTAQTDRIFYEKTCPCPISDCPA
ncbi:hypothetical protein [Moraxella marmotae]